MIEPAIEQVKRTLAHRIQGAKERRRRTFSIHVDDAVTILQFLASREPPRVRFVHPDAPPVPDGKRPRQGVTYGCGRPDCDGCYEPIPSGAQL